MHVAFHSLSAFIRHVLFHRDRYLTELLSSVVTFAVGVLASMSQPQLETRSTMAGFRDMAYPELWLLLMASPGLIAAIRYGLRPDAPSRWMPTVVMGSVVVLCASSLIAGLDNWAFWALLALLIGVMQGYAAIAELAEARWGIATVGTFFWLSLAVSVTLHAEYPWPLGIALYWGFALANLLSLLRLPKAS